MPNQEDNMSEDIIGDVQNILIDEKFVSFSRSTHKAVFNYEKNYYPILLKKFTKNIKLVIPSLINELKKIFRIHYLPGVNFRLSDKIANRKYYYTAYLRSYPDNFIKYQKNQIYLQNKN